METCSWQYWSNYHLRLPDKGNDGSKRGTICHLIFEILGEPRHRKHYTKIIRADDVRACEPVKRLIEKNARNAGVDDKDNIDCIYDMVLNGLKYDFFGATNGKPTKCLDEKDFDINYQKDGHNFRVRGFIDKLFLFKKKGFAKIRDFKSSRATFSGKDVSDNVQDLVYRLAVEYLYPDYTKRQMEFVFLKFDCSDESSEGIILTPDISEHEMEGFKSWLTNVQKVINNFDIETAKSSFAYDKGYPAKEDGFAGKLVCGRADTPFDKKKDGNPKWFCPCKFAYNYFKVCNEEGAHLYSLFENDVKGIKNAERQGYMLVEAFYEGCPKFQWLDYNKTKNAENQ
jgi:hypothetical protein